MRRVPLAPLNHLLARTAILADEDVNEGGSPKVYRIEVERGQAPSRHYQAMLEPIVIVLPQQCGQVDAFGCGANGVPMESLLAIVADKLACFQAGPHACRENQDALNHVVAALEILSERSLRVDSPAVPPYLLDDDDQTEVEGDDPAKAETQRTEVDSEALEHELETISGVGPRFREELKNRGYPTVYSVAAMDDAAIPMLADEIDGASAKAISNWRKQARELIHARNQAVAMEEAEAESD